MSLSRAIIRRRSLCRRLVVGLAVVAYLVAAIGFPMPATASRDDGGDPFSCQGRGCGCPSEDQCRRQCCCSSGAQPGGAVRPPAASDSCCQRDRSKSAWPGPVVSPLRCQGLTVLWAAATAGFAPPASCDCRPTWPLVGSVATTEHKSCQISSLPSTPPPRHVAG